MRDIVLVADGYSLEKGKESFPEKEFIIVSDLEKEKKKLSKEGHQVMTFVSFKPTIFPHRNVVGSLQSSRFHGQISF